MNLKQKLAEGRLFLDGGTGTVLQTQGLGAGEKPERWNILYPERISALHRGYFEQGSDIAVSNTFGANRLTYPHGGEFEPQDIVTAGVNVLRDTADAYYAETGRKVYAALDIGPTGHILAPAGDLPFEEAVEIFAEMVRAGAEAGAELVVIETMSDSLETKAAVVAARENCDLPIFVTNAYSKQGRLLSGSTPEVMAAILQAMGVTAFGLNCGLGPAEMQPLVKRLYNASYLPVIAKPNAGLPCVENGKTTFPVGAEEFGSLMKNVAAVGARVMGGCCGTGFGHIGALCQAAGEYDLLPLGTYHACTAASRKEILEITEETVFSSAADSVLHEEIAQAMAEGDYDTPFEEAMDALDDEADIVCLSAPTGDGEGRILAEAAEYLQTMISAPLMLRASCAEALEKAVRQYNGVPVIGYTSGGSVETLVTLAGTYGAVAAVEPESLEIARAIAKGLGYRTERVIAMPALS